MRRLYVVSLGALLLTAMAATPVRAEPPKLDCGHGFEVLFCPLKIPAFVVEARYDLVFDFMDHGERIAYAVLDGINFFGEQIGVMADRIDTTEALIVDVAEDLLPGVILARTVQRLVENVTAPGTDELLPRAILDANSLILKQQSLKRPVRPNLLDYGARVSPKQR